MLRDGLAEYGRICDVYRELHARYEKRRAEVCSLLEEAAEARRLALRELGKAEVLTRRLTAYQARELGFPHHGENPRGAFAKDKSRGNPRKAPFELEPFPAPSFPQDFRNSRELRSFEAGIISMIDDLKNKLLRLTALEMRCREILLSLGKAMKAYDYEYRRVKTRVYPFGLVSRIFKLLRRLWGRAYFTARDLAELAALGIIGAEITKMAESPVF